jgi:hypothetical protein
MWLVSLFLLLLPSPRHLSVIHVLFRCANTIRGVTIRFPLPTSSSKHRERRRCDVVGFPSLLHRSPHTRIAPTLLIPHPHPTLLCIPLCDAEKTYNCRFVRFALLFVCLFFAASSLFVLDQKTVVETNRGLQCAGKAQHSTRTPHTHTHTGTHAHSPLPHRWQWYRRE